jgi:haloacetate dehalogenase
MEKAQEFCLSTGSRALAWSWSDARVARTYWPWILLSQKEPLPESYLLGAPEAVFHNSFGEGSFGPEVLAEYVSTYRDPARVHGICEEYRLYGS